MDARVDGADEELRGRMAANCGGAYREWARRMGRPWALHEDLSLGDLQLPTGLPPNNATLLAPPDPTSGPALADRLAAFFDDGPGGPYEVWSAWPTPDLSPFGFEPFRVPGMVRDAGGEAPRVPDGLRIEEVDDDGGLAHAEEIIDEVFGAHAGRGRSLREGIVDEDFRVFVAFHDDRPVATASAFVSDGFVGVYAVATLPEMRGRRYGEAVSWAATMSRPDLPATLQASGMGRPVYERMGFRVVTDFQVWSRARSGVEPA